MNEYCLIPITNYTVIMSLLAMVVFVLHYIHIKHIDVEFCGPVTILHQF